MLKTCTLLGIIASVLGGPVSHDDPKQIHLGIEDPTEFMSLSPQAQIVLKQTRSIEDADQSENVDCPWTPDGQNPTPTPFSNCEFALESIIHRYQPSRGGSLSKFVGSCAAELSWKGLDKYSSATLQQQVESELSIFKGQICDNSQVDSFTSSFWVGSARFMLDIKTIPPFSSLELRDESGAPIESKESLNDVLAEGSTHHDQQLQSLQADESLSHECDRDAWLTLDWSNSCFLAIMNLLDRIPTGKVINGSIEQTSGTCVAEFIPSQEMVILDKTFLRATVTHILVASCLVWMHPGYVKYLDAWSVSIKSVDDEMTVNSHLVQGNDPICINSTPSPEAQDCRDATQYFLDHALPGYPSTPGDSEIAVAFKYCAVGIFNDGMERKSIPHEPVKVGLARIQNDCVDNHGRPGYAYLEPDLRLYIRDLRNATGFATPSHNLAEAGTGTSSLDTKLQILCQEGPRGVDPDACLKAMDKIKAGDDPIERYGGVKESSGNCNVGFNAVDFAPIFTNDDAEFFKYILETQVFPVCDPTNHGGAKVYGGVGEEHEWELFFRLAE